MMAVFVPVSFLGGTSGTFYRQFGITMAIAIGFSALNALTLSPALCAIFLKAHNDERPLGARVKEAQGEALQIMKEKYNALQFVAPALAHAAAPRGNSGNDGGRFVHF